MTLKLALLLIEVLMVVIWLVALCRWIYSPNKTEQEENTDGLF